MGAVHLPPEIWDRIFDLLPFGHQLRTATVCQAWNGRVARWATLRLSCLDHRRKDHVSAIRQSLRSYRSFSVETLRTEDDYQCIQKAVKVCERKFIVQKFRFRYVTAAMLERFVQEHFHWFCTVRSLLIHLTDDGRFTMDVLQNLSNLRELRLLNVCDTTVDWSVIRSTIITKLTIDAAWYFNDEALEELLDAVSSCRNLTDLTLRSNDTTSLGRIADSLTRLERLTLLSMTVRLAEDVLSFPVLKYLNFDIEWFVFDKPYLVLRTPLLQSLKISKKTIHFVKFSECTGISRLDLFGHSLSTVHPCFASVKELNLTTWEPPNQEAVVEEIQLFPNVRKLSVKLCSKECTIPVPEAVVFRQVTRLHLNNFVLSMKFFVDIERMKLLEHLSLEECNFFPESTDDDGDQANLSHLSYFNVKRVSMAMTVEKFPIITNEDQPPIVIVDKLRTHLWRNDHFNVFSSRSD